MLLHVVSVILHKTFICLSTLCGRICPLSFIYAMPHPR